MENKFLIAVSGGPDSIYLLNKFIKEKKEVVVAHLNYNLRKESIDEQKYLEEFCKSNNIKIYVKNVLEADWEKFNYLKNKQSIAREIRYRFFIDIASKEKVKSIYVGHHKDDFIETAIMQYKRSTDYFFYGIKEESNFKDLIIKRPLLNYYKSNLMKELDDNKIKYFLDKTNYKPIYERNKIRKELSKKTIEEKDEIFLNYKKINDSKLKFQIELDEKYNEFKNLKYSWDYFNSLNNLFKSNIIYKFLLNSETRININKNKIDSLILFLEHKNGNKKYRLMKNIFITVKSSKITILNINNGNRK